MDKNNLIEIIQDEKFLRQKSEPATYDEAQEIAEQLFMTLLEKNDNDVGLSAPQIGILKQVCVIRVKEPIVLVNPRIVETEGDTTWFQEGCLSFPGVTLRTRRYKSIFVEADYLGTGHDVAQMWQKNVKLYFSDDGDPNKEDDMGLLECATP